MGDSFFCFLKNKVRDPKKKPLEMAIIVPIRLVCVRSSAKNSVIPAITVAMVNQSFHVARSPRNAAPSSAIQTGEVYWSSMAFAAVVSLLANANEITVPA